MSIVERDATFGRRIDIHVHIADSLGQPTPEVLGRALRLANHHGIGQLVHLGNMTAFDATPDPSPELIGKTNDYTLAAMALHPGIIVGFCYVNPANPKSFTQNEIARCIGEGGMRGIKLWVAVNAQDERLDPIMELASEYGVPILHHAWYKQTLYAHNESTPADVAHLARRFPGVPIIMAHPAGGGARGVLDIVDVPNVLVDTSGGQPESDLVEYAVAQLGAERVVFGSDVPGRGFGPQLGRVLGARISEQDRELILYGNAARLLRLEEGAR